MTRCPSAFDYTYNTAPYYVVVYNIRDTFQHGGIGKYTELAKKYFPFDLIVSSYIKYLINTMFNSSLNILCLDDNYSISIKTLPLSTSDLVRLVKNQWGLTVRSHF